MVAFGQSSPNALGSDQPSLIGAPSSQAQPRSSLSGRGRRLALATVVCAVLLAVIANVGYNAYAYLVAQSNEMSRFFGVELSLVNGYLSGSGIDYSYTFDESGLCSDSKAHASFLSGIGGNVSFEYRADNASVPDAVGDGIANHYKVNSITVTGAGVTLEGLSVGISWSEANQKLIDEGWSYGGSWSKSMDENIIYKYTSQNKYLYLYCSPTSDSVSKIVLLDSTAMSS